MQDRFKFRHWDKKIKQMRYGDIQLGCNGVPFVIAPESTELIQDIDDVITMQCTGLKDKNGTLIYEGDIVEVQYMGAQIPLFQNEYSRQPEIERFEIFCSDEWLKFYAKNDYYRKFCEIHYLDLDKITINTYNKQYEIIGNIYENPELLEMKK